jgi:hypothetical protein
MPLWTRLATVAGVLCLVLAPPLAAQDSGGFMSAAERQEITRYRLTMDNVRKAAVAGAKLNALEKDPKVKAAMDREEAVSLTDAIQKLNGLPEARAAVESSGLTAKDFMYTIVSLVNTAAALEMLKAGGSAAKAAAQVDTSPQNLEFYAAHKAEIEPLQAQMRRSDQDDDE